MAAVQSLDPDLQRRSVERALIKQFGAAVPPEEITERVQARMAEYADARVQTFVPVLVQREVSDELRRITAHDR